MWCGSRTLTASTLVGLAGQPPLPLPLPALPLPLFAWPLPVGAFGRCRGRCRRPGRCPPRWCRRRRRPGRCPLPLPLPLPLPSPLPGSSASAVAGLSAPSSACGVPQSASGCSEPISPRLAACRWRRCVGGLGTVAPCVALGALVGVGLAVVSAIGLRRRRRRALCRSRSGPPRDTTSPRLVGVGRQRGVGDVGDRGRRGCPRRTRSAASRRRLSRRGIGGAAGRRPSVASSDAGGAASADSVDESRDESSPVTAPPSSLSCSESAVTSERALLAAAVKTPGPAAARPPTPRLATVTTAMAMPRRCPESRGGGSRRENLEHCRDRGRLANPLCGKSRRSQGRDQRIRVVIFAGHDADIVRAGGSVTTDRSASRLRPRWTSTRTVPSRRPMIVGDLGDAEVGDHPQQHGLGLIGWQRPDQRQRPVERTAPARTRRRPTGRVTRRAPFAGAGRCCWSRACWRADVVDPAAGRDREQPAPEIGLAALEAMQAVGDLDPHRRGQIVGIGHALAPEVAQQQVVVGAPELAERVAIALACACDHLLHSL